MADDTFATYDVPRQNALWHALSRNRLSWLGIGLLAVIVAAAVFAPLIAPYDPLQQNILSMVVGSTIGIISGYIGGVFDRIVMSVLDVMLSFPTLLLGLMIAAMLGASLENLIIAIAITETAPFARVARAPTISLKERDFVEAGRAMGFGPARIMGVHILPNMVSEVVVMGSMWMASAIRTEASLSFIGLGVPPPTPTWGGMISEGFDNILDAWWLAVFPSLAILLTVLALNILGDALRDAIDPKTRVD